MVFILGTKILRTQIQFQNNGWKLLELMMNYNYVKINKKKSF